MGKKLPVKRRKRAFGEAALHVEDGLRAERAADRQQKAKRGAAFAAKKMARRLRHGADGADGQRVILHLDLRAECAEAGGGRVNVPGAPVQPQTDRMRSERRADQQPVRL